MPLGNKHFVPALQRDAFGIANMCRNLSNGIFIVFISSILIKIGNNF